MKVTSPLLNFAVRVGMAARRVARGVLRGKLSRGAVLMLALMNGATLYAQEVVHLDDSEDEVALPMEGDSVRPTAFQQEGQPGGTLPPVEVQPSDLPPSIVTGGEVGDIPPGPFDFPSNYPSLSSQRFDSSSSGIRGLNRSVFDLPNNATIVDRETIREKQAQTIMQALQNETGVLVQQTGRGQSSIFMRGVTGQQLLIMVDGVRVNNSTLRAGPNQYAAMFDPGSIDRIELIRGSQSTMWGGDAIGGVVNIVTRGANPNRGNYTGTNFMQTFSSADLGTYSRASLEGWVGRQGVFGGGSYLDNDNLDRGGGLGRQPGTEYSQYAFDLKYNFLVSDTDLLTVAMQHFEQQDVPRSDRFAPFVSQNIPSASARPTYFDPQQRDLIYARLQGEAISPFYDTYAHTVSWQFNKEGTTEQQGTQLTRGEFDVNTWGYTMTFTKDLESWGIVSYGGDYYNDAIDSVRSRRANNAAPFVPVASAQYPNDATYDRGGIYAMWDLQVTQRLNILAGGRYENVNASGTPLVTLNNVANTPYYFDRTYQDWVGNIGATYTLTDTVNAVGGIYEGFRAPTIDDLTADKTFLQNATNVPTVGALAVQPEHSTTYEVGLKKDGERFRGGVYQWWMTINDYMTRVPDANNVVVLGNSNAALHGTELNGEYLVDSSWSVYGNFWYTWGNDTNTGDVYPRIPPTQGTLGLRWRDEERLTYVDLYTWMVDQVEARHYPRSLFNNLGQSTDARFPTGGTAGYATLNLRLGKTFGETQAHRVSATFYNLTDRYYRVLGSGVDGEGFNALVSYEYKR